MTRQSALEKSKAQKAKEDLTGQLVMVKEPKCRAGGERVITNLRDESQSYDSKLVQVNTEGHKYTFFPGK